MAMNAFIRHKEDQQADIAEPVFTPQPIQANVPAPGSNSSKAAEIAKAQTSGVAIAVAPELNRSANSATAFSEKDAGTLRALSALQIRYGHAGEAIPYLMMLRKTNPEDQNAAQLLAKALMKLEKWDQAEMVLAGIKSSGDASDEMNRFVMLYRGIVAFKLRRISDARQWLVKFREKIMRGSQ